MLALECRKCSYKFERKDMPAKCPYCGSVGSVGRQKTAQDLLNDTFDEISSMEEDKHRRGY